MGYAQDVLERMKAYVSEQGWECVEKDEGKTKRLDIRYGKATCCFKIYENGTIQVQGAPSQLYDALQHAKITIENDGILVKDVIPFDIDKFPEKLQASIKDIDPIIVRFLAESIQCIKANSLLGCAFLLGAASEKAIWLLVEAFASAIDDDTNQKKFIECISGKPISKAYDDFSRRFKACKSKPVDSSISRDLETQINSIFQFFRICRNEVGHPHIPPNLDKGILLANMGQFMKYMEAIYRLIAYFAKTKVKL